MRLAILSLLAGLALSACGDSTVYNCCFNNAYYSCMDQSSLDKCAMGTFDGCTRDAAKDNSCTK